MSEKPSNSGLSRWSAAAFAVALAVWIRQIWTFYIPHGISEYFPNLPALIPEFSGFAVKSWWIDAAGACLLTFAAICIGSMILERLEVECDPLEHLFFSGGVGFCALILAASSLAMLALFRPVPLRVLLIAFALAAIPRAPREGRLLRETLARALRALRREPLAAAPLALAIVFSIFAFVVAAAPETAYDALVAYFPYSRLFLRRGTFYMIELQRSNMPLYGIVYYSLGIASHGESAARILNFLTLPGLLLGVAVLTRKVMSRPGLMAPALAVFWAASCPVLFHHATICLPDLPMALCCSLGLIAALRQVETRSPAWAVLAGGFFGMAAGIKYAGLYWVIIGGLIILAGGYKQWRSTVRAAVLFSVVALAMFSPWLIRNWVHTGDPLHPSFQKYLAHPAIDPVEAEEHMRDALNYNRLPTTPGNIFALPWRLTMEGDRWQGTIGPVFLWALPLILLGFRKNMAWILTAAALPLFALIWFTGPQWARYFLPGIPLAAALTAAGVCHPRLPKWLSTGAAAAGVVLALVNLPGFNRAWVGGGVNTMTDVPYQTVFGRATADEYRRRFIPGYDAVKYLNAQALPDSSIVLPVPAMALFPPWISRMNILDIWDNGHIVCEDARQKPADCYTITGRALRRNMDLAGVSVIGIRRDADWAANRLALRLEDPFLRANFRLIGYGGGAFFYQRNRLGPEPGLPYVNTDLLYRAAVHWDAAVDESAIRMMPVQSRGGDERLCLVFQHPGQARFEMDLGDRPWLSFFLGWAEGAAVDEGSEVAVEAGGRVIWTHYFTGDDAPQGWREYRVDLSAFAGRRVPLVLRVGPRPGGAPGVVSMADPVVYARETDEPVSDESVPWLFNTATKRNPVAVRFSPARVSVHGSYTMEIPQLAGEWIDLLIARGDGLPEQVLKFRRLDQHGRTLVQMPDKTQPMTVYVRGVRKAGDRLWLASEGKIEVVP